MKLNLLKRQRIKNRIVVRLVMMLFCAKHDYPFFGRAAAALSQNACVSDFCLGNFKDMVTISLIDLAIKNPLLIACGFSSIAFTPLFYLTKFIGG
jgi:hypothetical protein